MSMAMFGRRISWAAIFAGVLSATFCQLLLGSLGGAIGANVVAAGTNVAKEAGVGVGIWLLVSTIISMFVGGWVAGRMSGIPRKTEGVLHGFLTASLSVLFTMFMLASAIGGVFGVAANLAGSGLQAAGDNPTATGQATGVVENIRAQIGNVSQPEAGQAADQAAKGTAAAGYGLFLLLLLAAGSSMAGGYASAPKTVRPVEVDADIDERP